VPAPTSVLCGSQIAQSLLDQYSCSRVMASWNVRLAVALGLGEGPAGAEAGLDDDTAATAASSVTADCRG